MIVTHITDQRWAQIKADAAARFGGRALQIDLPDPINATIVVAPHDHASFAKYVDAQARDPQTAKLSFRARLLYPSHQDLENLLGEWAALPDHISGAMNIEAFAAGPSPEVEVLDPSAPPPGLSPEDAARLLASEAHVAAEAAKDAAVFRSVHPAKLWRVQLDAAGLSCVMRTPITETWRAARTRFDDAMRAGKGIVESLEPYLLAAVVWSREPIEPLLDRRPGLFWDLNTAHRRMGGDGIAVRTKSL